MTKLWDQFCSDIAPFTTHIPAEEFDYTVNISLRHRYVYAENAKVACSTIKLILQRMELDDPDYRPEDLVDLHTRIFSPLIRPAQVKSFSRYIQRSDVVKFCFVRNPYSRLLSAWLDKIENNMTAKKGILRQLGFDPEDLGRPVSFADFVHAVAGQSIAEMDQHWRVQYYQTFQQQIQYDFIGRFESLETDLESVLNTINPEFHRFWGREDRHATHSEQQLKACYTDQIEDMVYRIYRKDFQQFKYSRM